MYAQKIYCFYSIWKKKFWNKFSHLKNYIDILLISSDPDHNIKHNKIECSKISDVVYRNVACNFRSYCYQV
jgi:hypothetical protein